MIGRWGWNRSRVLVAAWLGASDFLNVLIAPHGMTCYRPMVVKVVKRPVASPDAEKMACFERTGQVELRLGTLSETEA